MQAGVRHGVELPVRTGREGTPEATESVTGRLPYVLARAVRWIS